MKIKLRLAGILLLAACVAQAQDQQVACIYVRNAGTTDTINFSYWDDLICSSSSIVQGSHKIQFFGREAVCKIPVNSPGAYTYCRVGISKKRVAGNWPVQAGDSIAIDLSAKTPCFTGKGAVRFRYYQWLDSMYNDWSQRIDPVPETLPAGMPREYSYHKSMLNCVANWQYKIGKALVELHSIQGELSAQDYAILQAELIGKAELFLLNNMIYYIYNFPVSFPQKDKDSLVNLIKEVYFSQRKQYVPDPGVFRVASLGYCDWLVNEAIRAPILYQQEPLDWIIRNHSGEQKDRLVTALLFRRTNNMDSASNAAFAAAISSAYYRKMASPFLSRIKRGAPAFPFALRDTRENIVKLEDFHGKLLVMDFWFTGCSGCAAVAPILEQIAANFTADDPIRFLSVSLDTDKQKWLNSVHGGKYATKGFIHLYTNGLGYDYPMISYYSLHAMPSIIIIDANGRLVSMNEPKQYTKEGIDEYISYLKQAMPRK